MRFLGILVCCLLLQFTGFGQDRIVQKPCFDSVLQHESSEMKARLEERGFELVREATMTMESEYEMPVIVPLNQGSLYAFVFIGDTQSKLYEVRMYDWEERQVVYKKNGIESNIIAYQYVPVATEYHVIKPVQVTNIKKKKQLCGYIMMFRKTSK